MPQDYEDMDEPVGLSLCIAVTHPASDTSDEYTPEQHDQLAESCGDADGHRLVAMIQRTCDETTIVSVNVQHGVNAASAGAILRKLADRIEGAGTGLLSMKRGGFACWDNDSRFKVLTSGNEDPNDGGIHLPKWATEWLLTDRESEELDRRLGDGEREG